MHLVIISASPRSPARSNTAIYTNRFREGLSACGVTSELYFLCDRAQWPAARSAFIRSSDVLIALPLYNAGAPGLMHEFLEQLSECLPKPAPQPAERRISFLLHSAFPEACHRQWCERYLETLPALLDSRFAGILSYGNSYTMNFTGSTPGEFSHSFSKMGELFAQNGGTFFFPEAAAFNGPVNIPEEDARKFIRIFKFVCRQSSQIRGCTDSLSLRPYESD